MKIVIRRTREYTRDDAEIRNNLQMALLALILYEIRTSYYAFFRAYVFLCVPPDFDVRKFYLLATQCICMLFMDFGTNSDYFPT